jgi:hypothetical protein
VVLPGRRWGALSTDVGIFRAGLPAMPARQGGRPGLTSPMQRFGGFDDCSTFRCSVEASRGFAYGPNSESQECTLLWLRSAPSSVSSLEWTPSQ